jgi:methylglutaconyl-CoA hydratase
MNDLATLAVDGRVATLTLNRPDARNALSTPMLVAMTARADELALRDDVQILVLTGAGRAFCAGMDLKAVLGDPPAALGLLTQLADFTVRLRTLPQVVIGRINGAAIGGGCGLACVCDFAITHADSKMGFPEVDLGVCPAVVAPWLVRKVGAGRARTILLEGGLMTGAEAFARGIVSAVSPDTATLDSHVTSLVDRLSKGGPRALRATKQLLNELDGSVDAEIVRRGARLSAEVLQSPEAQTMLRSKLGPDNPPTDKPPR